MAVWIVFALIINAELAKGGSNINLDRELILTVRNNDEQLMRGINLWIADELIPPQKEDQSKYAIPLRKFIEEDDKILIDQTSETGEAQKSMKMEYDPKTPRITIYIKNR